MRRRQAFALCFFLFAVVAHAQQQLTKISGVVSDPNGSAIANASVEFASKGNTIRTETDAAGSFTVLSAQAYGTLSVSSPGFSTIKFEVTTTSEPLRIRLEPAAVIERILVTDNAERIPSTPISQFALSQNEISLAGALTLDDVLREVPGFSLFRRSGGLTANPTSQGVSLRGVGANGASRALVLLDGVPLNSPFGGWVYWNRLPRVSVEDVHVNNSATSDMYGSGALGGVINVNSRTSPATFLDFEASGGNEVTGATSFSGGKQFGAWGLGFSGQALHTDGYVLVPADQRGPVDTPAGTGDLTGSLTLSRNLRRDGHAFVRLSSFGESRRNGTPVQLNDTRISSVDLGFDWSDAVSLRLYGSKENFNQNFSAIAADRGTESLTNRQRNPSQQIGFAFQWRKAIGGHQMFSVGAEGRDVRGHSAETTFNNSRVTAFVDAGGRQDSVGFFASDSVQFRSWFFNAGARVDRWKNSRGFSDRIPVTGLPSLNDFPDRSQTAFSPRISLMKRFDNGLSLSASAYHAFRAPTLNELYRNFRVGNVVTNANAALKAERLTGGDAGVGVERGRVFVRSNFFWSEIDDSVANVTLSMTPALITRQRQNLGTIRARGIEVSAITRFEKHWEISSEYLLTDSTVLSFPANRALEGLLVPQVPRHQLNFQVSYSNSAWVVGTQGRFVSTQFDDDQNTLPLDGFFTLDAEVSRRVSEHVRLFAAFQNLTGSRYQISSTPVFTIGPPTLFRLGVRLSLRQ
ncbi:MAG TPA: TonB-dependent receptor [Pyrinomonadaceae bacterium]|nr:TonB-dependent receptor [Pyrinomonadaceae bacterium]